jgi:hypothetical protein
MGIEITLLGVIAAALASWFVEKLTAVGRQRRKRSSTWRT